MPLDQYRAVEGVTTSDAMQSLTVTLPDKLEEFRHSLRIYKLVPPKPVPVPAVQVEGGNYFNDGVREIDFILVYNMSSSAQCKIKVNSFLKKAENQGLQFESEMGKDPEIRNLLFIKAHCPEDVLLNSAIAYNIEFESLSKNHYLKKLINKNRTLKWDRFHTKLTKRLSSQTKSINTAERIMVIYEILKNVKYGKDFSEFSVESLVKRKYLVAAYPLHDGPSKWDDGPINDRQLLARYWANLSNWSKLQPIDHIKRYYGGETAFYFTLSGHYNQSLIVGAALGLVSIIYGSLLCQLPKPNYFLEVCSSNIIICPYCFFVPLCHYYHLKGDCILAAFTFIFNNFFTYIYGIFMCFWAVYFLIKWFRTENLLRYQWNLSHVEKDLDFRWEYAERSEYRRWSKITRQTQPHVPIGIRAIRIIFSIFILFLLFILIIIMVILTMVVRQAVKYLLTTVRNKVGVEQTVEDHLLKMGSAYTLSVGIILLLEALLFNPIVVGLTDFENPRTREQYEASLIFKLYLLYTLNAYAQVFYTAFIKGAFFTHPAAIRPEGIDIFNSDSVGPLGCMVFINFQIAVLIFFRFFFTVLFRYIIPLLKYRNKKKELKERTKNMAAWEFEYFMQPTDRYFLLREHLDLFISHGYTSMFATAFPLGSLTALLTNSLLMRLDAYMLTYVKRRPIPVKRAGIHYWNALLINGTYIAVIINVFIIAFTSDLVPYLIYTEDGNSKSFLSRTVSRFNLEDFQPGLGQLHLSGTNSCMYHGQRHPPGHQFQYQLTGFYWQERVCRFAAVLIIEGCIVIFALAFSLLVPELPRYIKEFLYEKSRRLSDQKHDYAAKVLANS